jgi:hypothetical protein
VSALAKATLQRLRYAKRPDAKTPAKVQAEGPALDVQFNPASLKISRRNNVDRGGLATGNQKRTSPAQEASTLSFDLEFDTAEQGSAGRRVDVREWTAVVRQFVEPPPDAPGGPPPAVRFAWGTIVFDGIIDDVTEDLGYFAPDGTPLRAKVSVSISEQNFAYELLAQGAGTLDARGATAPGTPSPGNAPGYSGTRNPETVATARNNESVQQLLVREGLAPTAWRSAMNGLDSPLSLPAGTPVQLGPESRSVPAATGTPGFASGVAPTSVASVTAALGLSGVTVSAAAAGGTVSADPTGRAAGFALSAVGGIAAAARSVAVAGARDAAAAARSAFAVPAAPTAAATAGDVLEVGAETVDPRALSYGSGVPLQSRGHPETLAQIASGGARSLLARARPAELPEAAPHGAPWEALPPPATRR